MKEKKTETALKRAEHTHHSRIKIMHYIRTSCSRIVGSKGQNQMPAYIQIQLIKANKYIFNTTINIRVEHKNILNVCA